MESSFYLSITSLISLELISHELYACARLLHKFTITGVTNYLYFAKVTELRVLKLHLCKDNCIIQRDSTRTTGLRVINPNQYLDKTNE